MKLIEKLKFRYVRVPDYIKPNMHWIISSGVFTTIGVVLGLLDIFMKWNNHAIQFIYFMALLLDLYVLFNNWDYLRAVQRMKPDRNNPITYGCIDPWTYCSVPMFQDAMNYIRTWALHHDIVYTGYYLENGWYDGDKSKPAKEIPFLNWIVDIDRIKSAVDTCWESDDKFFIQIHMELMDRIYEYMTSVRIGIHRTIIANEIAMNIGTRAGITSILKMLIATLFLETGHNEDCDINVSQQTIDYLGMEIEGKPAKDTDIKCVWDEYDKSERTKVIGTTYLDYRRWISEHEEEINA